jgi:5'(3')-deoxyribonucleotidase
MIKNIAFDLDDTACNLRVPMNQALNFYTGKAIHWKDWTGHNLEEIYEITSKEFVQILIDGHVIERANPVPKIKETLDSLKEKGYNIHIITARGWHPNGMAITEQWFEDNKIPFDSINIVPLGGSKADIMDNIGNIKYLIDDNENNCKEVISRGYDAYLVPMPWNKNSGLKRLNSIEEILTIL